MPYGGNTLDGLHSGISYSAVGREFNVNEPAIYRCL